MGAVLDFLDRLWTAIKVRKAAKAAADVARGSEIIAQAQREADEMRAAAEAMEARKRVDPQLTLPLVKP